MPTLKRSRQRVGLHQASFDVALVAHRRGGMARLLRLLLRYIFVRHVHTAFGLIKRNQKNSTYFTHLAGQKRESPTSNMLRDGVMRQI